MMVFAVGTVTGVPARRLASRQAAATGSTESSAVTDEGSLGAEFCPLPGHPSVVAPPRFAADR